MRYKYSGGVGKGAWGGIVPAAAADATVLHPAAANRQANFFPPETADDKAVMPEDPASQA